MLWVILGVDHDGLRLSYVIHPRTELNHLSLANALELVLVQIVICVYSYVC